MLIPDQNTSEEIKNLMEAVNKQSQDIKKLYEHDKWLYKYGGSGTGIGGFLPGTTPDSNKSYLLIINVGLETHVLTSTAPSKSITIYPKKGLTIYASVSTRFTDNTASYLYRYKKATDALYTNFNVSLGVEGMVPLNCYNNDVMEIRCVDSNGDSRTLFIEYITDYITVEPLILADSDHNIIASNNNEVLMSSYDLLFAKFKYNLLVEGEITYTYTDIEGYENTVVSHDSEELYIPLFSTQGFMENENNLGFYQFSISATYVPSGSQMTLTLNIEPLSISLIPSSIYVLVIPDSGNVYTTKVTSNPFVYLAGFRTFKITLYKGAFDRETFELVTVTLKRGATVIDTEILSNSVLERQPLTYSVFIDESSTKPQLYTLEVSFLDGGQAVKREFYFYVIESETSFSWYDIPKNSLLAENYFNKAGLSTIAELENQKVLSFKDNSLTIPLKTKSADTKELLITFGIQYNEITPATAELVLVNTALGASNAIIITLQSVKIDTTSTEIFIPKESYESFKSGEYHLVALYRRLVNVIGVTARYEWDVYIDGILEKVFTSFTESAGSYTSITFNREKKANFLINHFGVYEMYVASNTALYTANYTGLDDLAITQYYYKYKDTISTTVDPRHADILNSYKAFKYNFQKNNYREEFVEISENVRNSICSTAGVPALLVEINGGWKKSNVLSTISDTSYGEEDTFSFENCDIQYRKEGSNTVFETYKLTDNLKNSGVRFILALQGSSTKSYRSKNFSLTAALPENSEDNVLVLYALDYNPENPNTLYPETTFTLKADLVDSSHSNNVCCGDFINQYMTPYRSREFRNCLTGNPMLLFIKVADDNDEAVHHQYLLGIYNFNLGRDSQNNLGHVNTKTPVTLDGFLVEGVSTNNLADNFFVAEIANNDSHWDFSQYDPSILFLGACYSDASCSTTLEDIGEQLAESDSFYMWGDVKFRATDTFNKNVVRQYILNAVKSISELGGNLFNAIGKSFEVESLYAKSNLEVALNYKLKNVVPDFKTLFKRYQIQSGSSISYSYKPYDDTENQNHDLETSMLNTIYGSESAIPVLDYNSALQYYVVCMAVGLVDSVQKNLNIKKWNNSPLFIAFYDMDTCLGIDNAGQYISPFAFSDYWAGTGENGQVEVFRDYWESSDTVASEDGHSAGYDIPSSYLFAIPKYVEYVRKYKNLSLFESLSTPTIEWAKLRSPSTGPLKDAQYFVDNYFNAKTKNINEVLWNINYRYKYLLVTRNNNVASITGFEPKDISFFHGRRVHKTKDWLNKRLHVLDAYFNINNFTYSIGNGINEGNDSLVTLDLQLNPDILVLRQIFNGGSPDEIKANNSIVSVVKVKEFSPLIAKYTKGIVRYLLFDPNTEYTLSIPVDGNQSYAMFGSDTWTYLDSLNSYIPIKQTLSIKSKLIQKLVANNNELTASSWVFDCPSLSELELTGSKFEGDLSILNASSLKKLDITGTAIRLVLTDATTNVFTNLLELIMTNVNIPSSSLLLTNTTNLNRLEINGMLATSLNIGPICGNVSIYGTSVNSMTFAAAQGSEASFTLNGDDTITSLTLSGFKSVNITSCRNLKSITLNDTTLLTPLENLSITRCLSAITINSTTEGTANLTNLKSLKSVLFSGSNVAVVNLPPLTINIALGAFSDCAALATITGTINITNAVRCFLNCAKLHINNALLTIMFPPESITSIESMFACSSTRGVFNDADLDKLYIALNGSNNRDCLISMKSAFYYTSVATPSKILQKTTTRRYTSLTNIDEAFYYCLVSEVITADVLNIGADTMTSISGPFGSGGTPQGGWLMDGAVTFAKDAFRHFYDRLTSLSMHSCSIRFQDSARRVADLFGKFIKLKSLSNIMFVHDATTHADLGKSSDGYYALPESLETLSNFMHDNATRNWNTYQGVINTNRAFENLVNLKTLNNCFWIEDMDSGRINIATFFNWEVLKNQMKAIFWRPLNDTNENNYTPSGLTFMFKKTITLADFKSLLSSLSRSTIESLGAIFSNCVITDFGTDDSDKVTIPATLFSTNSSITQMCSTFYNCKLDSDLKVLDFESGLFKKLRNCAKYMDVWSYATLYRLWDVWFQDNKAITVLSRSFRGTNFKIPYSLVKSGKEYYYATIGYAYLNNKPVDDQTTVINNPVRPLDWDGHYMISPDFFKTCTANVNVVSLFAESNLFGLLPERLFSTQSSEMKCSGLFSNTNIIPYKVTSFCLVVQENQSDDVVRKLPVRINVFCYVPDGVDEEHPYINSLSLDYTFNTKVMIPVTTAIAVPAELMETLNLKVDGGVVETPLSSIQNFPVKVEFDQIYRGTEVPDGADVAAGYDINFLYFFNLNSISTTASLSYLLPRDTALGLYKVGNFNFRPLGELQYNYRIYIGTRFGGGEDVLVNKTVNCAPNRDGLVLTAPSTTATDMISGQLISLLYGPIFTVGTVLLNSSTPVKGSPIIGNWWANGRSNDRIVSRNVLFPKSIYQTTDFIYVYVDPNNTYSKTLTVAYSDLFVANSSPYYRNVINIVQQ